MRCVLHKNNNIKYSPDANTQCVKEEFNDDNILTFWDRHRAWIPWPCRRARSWCKPPTAWQCSGGQTSSSSPPRSRSQSSRPRCSPLLTFWPPPQPRIEFLTIHINGSKRVRAFLNANSTVQCIHNKRVERVQKIESMQNQFYASALIKRKRDI